MNTNLGFLLNYSRVLGRKAICLSGGIINDCHYSINTTIFKKEFLLKLTNVQAELLEELEDLPC